MMESDKCTRCNEQLAPDDLPTICSTCRQKVISLVHSISRRSVVQGLSCLAVAGAGIICLEDFAITPPMSSIRSNSKIRSIQGTTLYTINNTFGMKWSPNGKFLASGGDNVQIWDVAEEKNIVTCYGHSDEVLAVSWSPDSRYIASASFDQTVRVWNALTGDNIVTYRGHSNLVRDVAWSPDGKRIASASYDKTVQIWNAATGDQLLAYHGHSEDVIAVDWSPDGNHIASVDVKNTVKVW